MIFGSLFSGIGGMDLGLERAGMTCAWQVEIDDYASKVLTKQWPDVPKFRDVRECGKHNLCAVDLIAGGFPCQDISNAGNRAGIDGKRSGLWSEYARIIRELRPRFVLMENVAALLERGIERVLGDLAASGYDAEWQVLPAAAFGLPHIRNRVFLIAYPDSDSGQPQRNTSKPGIFPLSQWDYSSGLAKAQHRSREAATVVRGMDNGVPARMDRLRGLGNAVVPQVAQWIGERIMESSNL